MKNSWSCGRAAVPRTPIFRTVRMRDLFLKTLTKPSVWQSSESEKQDIPVLANVLQLPVNIRCPQRTICDRIEGLCMLLRRFSYPCRYSDMISRFGRPVSELCMITNEVMDNIFDNHSHRISQWNDDILNPYLLQEYADVIHAKGAPLENCFGFIDGTVRPIARPDQQQRIVYNGHKRVHSLKFQSVALPNGLIGNMYGPVGMLVICIFFY